MLARFFVDRPVFATVLSLVIMLMGGVALMQLPIAQYPEVAPPTIQISAVYPGANSQIVADTVAAPIEQEINGVERMLYMSSRCTNDGLMTLDVTFELGTNIDQAQVLVQNRVAIAESKLPDEVRRQGIMTKKKSPSILLAVNLISSEDRYDQLYLSNFATIEVKDALMRIPGVGDVGMLGSRDYAMRVWLDPEKLAVRNMTSIDVLQALREQNVQIAAGRIGQAPAQDGQDFQYAINTKGRLLDAAQFNDVVVKTGDGSELVRLGDVARTELGARNYDVSSSLDGKPSITMAVFQLPGSNALKTAQAIRDEMNRLKSTRFPSGVDFAIVYDTTIVVDESIHEVYKTLFEAFILVFLVVILFLQDWRATLMPMIDVPVSLIGTLAVMQWLGFSLNNLSMLGLVLAIGIVVDDAIVVVENIERWMAKGIPAREATIKAMGEITGPVIAITLVLSSVFLPTIFIAGIPGKFFQQFALTIAASTIISAINAMTMAPARAVTLIKPHVEGHDREALPRWGIALLAGYVALRFLPDYLEPLLGFSSASADAALHSNVATKSSGVHRAFLCGIFLTGGIVGWVIGPKVNWGLQKLFRLFNHGFDQVTWLYGKIVAGTLRISVIMLILYVGLIGLAVRGFQLVPNGFLPSQDKGYLVVSAKLPDGASLQRTEAVEKSINEILLSTDGIAHTLSIPGYSILTSTNASNSLGMFVILDSFEHRSKHQELYSADLVSTLQKKLSGIQEAQIVVLGAPPIDGLASTAGMKMQVQDRAGAGPAALQGALENLIEVANSEPRLVGTYSSYYANEPQLYVDINREKAKSAGVALNDVFQTLQIYLGSAYANDITRFGRNWQVNVQADTQFRANPADIGRLKVRNQRGEMVPLATLIDVRDVSGPGIVYRFNMNASADFVSNPAPGSGSGDTIGLMEEIAKRELPSSMSFEWTELAYQQILVGKDLLTKLVFPLAVIFVFMVLAAQYESWSMPIAILLIVPMCLFAAIAGLWLTGSESNIFTQIGLVVLIALAAKNAILIVEFAKQLQEEGKDRSEAVIEACKVRLRPILMTSFAFILGVAPLMIGRGAGFEMRRSLGLAVFSGMLGVTLFGLIFTPVFYVLIDWLGSFRRGSEVQGLHGTTLTPTKRNWWHRLIRSK
ncbi:MAG: efflux RND transporter permease subunit [Planctomycetota bacterium]|nr:efflux RND transporter permease subunit [Planctomycetota bacterium]